MNLSSPRVPALFFFLVTSLAHAEDFKIGMVSPPSAMGPHASSMIANVLVQNHLFESLVGEDINNNLVPKLALSWRNVDKLTWEFKLRKGVKFHDGSVMTAEDVVYSLERVKMYKAGGFAENVNGMTFKIVDPATIRVTTEGLAPELPFAMVGVSIMSKKASTGVKSDELDAGKGLVGTAPYKFVRFRRDDRLELARHEGYWGNKPAWSTVTLRFITNPGTRLAALLAGDVQAIERVPSQDLAKVRANPAFTTYARTSTRVSYLTPDVFRKVSPFVTAKDGKALDRNPLMDARVRQALSMAISRDMIRDRVLEGLGEPTGNLVPSFRDGYDPSLKVPRHDPVGARKLLAQAGYPDGFALTLHAPSDRTPNVAIAIASMWARIGVATKIDGAPNSVFYTRARSFDYSMSLMNIDVPGGKLSAMVGGMLMCPNEAKGTGSVNMGRYCNPALDVLAENGSETLDDKARQALFQQAAAIGMNDAAIIPLYHMVSSWAMKKDYVFQGSGSGGTYAYAFSKK